MQKNAHAEMEALQLFKGDMGSFGIAYTFLSQSFDYGNTALEKRAIFYKRLIPLLEFEREREGIDLSKITLTYHTLRDTGKRLQEASHVSALVMLNTRCASAQVLRTSSILSSGLLLCSRIERYRYDLPASPHRARPRSRVIRFPIIGLRPDLLRSCSPLSCCGNYGSVRKKECEYGAMAMHPLAASASKHSVVPPYDFCTQPKADARSEDSFGAEKCLKRASLDIRTHTAAVVRDGDHYAFTILFPVACLPTPEQKSAPLLRKRVNGVGDQIVQHLPDLAL